VTIKRKPRRHPDTDESAYGTGSEHEDTRRIIQEEETLIPAEKYDKR
jgi:hypothetical protein